MITYNENNIAVINSPEDISLLKRDQVFMYKCTNPECGKMNTVKFPGHHAKDRIAKLSKMLCKDCSQKASKLETKNNLENIKKNAIYVKSVEEIRELPRGSWFTFTCKNCGTLSEPVSFQGVSRLYLHERMLCTKCSFLSTFDDEKRKETYRSKTGGKYDYPLQDPEVRAKGQATQRDKYDGLLFVQTETFSKFIKAENEKHPEWWQKGHQTQVERYGSSYLASADAQAKAREYRENTPKEQQQLAREEGMLRKRGYRYAMQDPEIKDKFDWDHRLYEMDGLPFASDNELYFYIYVRHVLDLEIEKVYASTKRFMFFMPSSESSEDDVVHYYTPDFRLGDIYIDVHSDYYGGKDTWISPNDKSERTSKYYAARYNCAKQHGVVILDDEDMKPAIEIVEQEFGPNFIDQFRVKK